MDKRAIKDFTGTDKRKGADLLCVLQRGYVASYEQKGSLECTFDLYRLNDDFNLELCGKAMAGQFVDIGKFEAVLLIG